MKSCTATISSKGFLEDTVCPPGEAVKEQTAPVANQEIRFSKKDALQQSSPDKHRRYKKCTYLHGVHIVMAKPDRHRCIVGGKLKFGIKVEFA